MCTFGERLREERKRLQLTQDELAEKLGITKQSQGLYERNQRTPNAEYLAGLHGLGGDVTFVLTGSPRLGPESSLTGPEKELLDNYRILKEQQQGFIGEAVAALAAAASKNLE